MFFWGIVPIFFKMGQNWLFLDLQKTCLLLLPLHSLPANQLESILDIYCPKHVWPTRSLDGKSQFMICWFHPGWVVNWKESLDFNLFFFFNSKDGYMHVLQCFLHSWDVCCFDDRVQKQFIIRWIHWTCFANWQKIWQTFIWMLCMKLHLHSQAVCFDKWNCNTANDLLGGVGLQIGICPKCFGD